MSSRCTIYHSVESRIKRLIELKRCKNCTRQDHSFNSCTVRLHCSVCNLKGHHPFLCNRNINNSRTLYVNTSYPPPAVAESLRQPAVAETIRQPAVAEIFRPSSGFEIINCQL